MIRRLLNVAYVLSLLLCLMMVLLWVRSYFRTDQFRASRAHWFAPTSYHEYYASFWSERGRFVLFIDAFDCNLSGRDPFDLSSVVSMHQGTAPEGGSLRWTDPRPLEIRNLMAAVRQEAQIDSHGIVLKVHKGNYTQQYTRKTIGAGSALDFDIAGPFWFITVLSALPCAVRLLVKCLGGRHTVAGKCQSCGYDLRASIGRCPECGTPIPVKATK